MEQNTDSGNDGGIPTFAGDLPPTQNCQGVRASSAGLNVGANELALDYQACQHSGVENSGVREAAAPSSGCEGGSTQGPPGLESRYMRVRFDDGDNQRANKLAKFSYLGNPILNNSEYESSDEDYLYPSSLPMRRVTANERLERRIGRNQALESTVRPPFMIQGDHNNIDHAYARNSRGQTGSYVQEHPLPDRPSIKRIKEWTVNNFDGKPDWDAYWAQFQLVARFNGWSQSMQAMHLVKSLVGSARTILADMTPDQMENLPYLIAALERRYRPREKVPAYRALFNGRRQQAKEGAQEFAEELRLLALKAFPNESQNSKESRLVDKFLEGLQDSDMKKHVMFQHPDSIEAAVSIAVEWEAFEEVQQVNGVKKPKDRERAYALVNSDHNWAKALERRIEALTLAVQTNKEKQEMKSETSGDRGQAPKTRYGKFNGKKIGQKAQNLENIQCYFCHEFGHYCRDCPKRAHTLHYGSVTNTTAKQSEN